MAKIRVCGLGEGVVKDRVWPREDCMYGVTEEAMWLGEGCGLRCDVTYDIMKGKEGDLGYMEGTAQTIELGT